MSIRDKLPKLQLHHWAAIALVLVIAPLFAILVWQLASLNPELYCRIVQHDGVPPGNHCFELLRDGLHIKGWVIWLLIVTLALFVLMVLSALTKISVALTGPNGLGMKLGGELPKQEPIVTKTTTTTSVPAQPQEPSNAAPTSR